MSSQANARFLASTRGQIVILLRQGHATVDDLATTLGLTDNAVRAHLAGLERLEWLGLGDAGVTDAGLEHLAGLKRLSVLLLRGTKVTDAGLKRLQGLARLTRLDLGRTGVTDEGVERLQASYRQIPPGSPVRGKQDADAKWLGDDEQIPRRQAAFEHGMAVIRREQRKPDERLRTLDRMATRQVDMHPLKLALRARQLFV